MNWVVLWGAMLGAQDGKSRNREGKMKGEET